MVPLSVLDLSPIPEGSHAGQALRNSLDLARHAEALGFRRYWMAEHHNLPGIASAATAVALAALHPGRVELGVGRAPGSDQTTAQAMRRTLQGGDEFPQDVVELMAYFLPVEPDQAIQAVPGAGLDVPVWILGSSTYGAQLAAILGLPFAFASHFAPAMMTNAMAIYRERFRPSAQLSAPNVMLGVNIVAAETDDEAKFLFSSLQQSFLNIRRGRPGQLPPPMEDFDSRIDPHGRAMLADALSCAIVGGPDTVERGMEDFIQRTGADELMVTANIFDHGKRKRSFEIVAQVHGGTKQAA